MKKLIFYMFVIFLFSCKKEDSAIYKNPQKGDVYINEIATLEGNISYNADPNANPNLVFMSGNHNNKVIEKELYKQTFFNDSILDIRKIKDNLKPNEIYYLDNKKTIKFIKIIDKNYLMKFKVQRGDEISILNNGFDDHIDGVELIDLNKDGIKDILLLEEGYFSNNFIYYFYIFSPIQ